MDLNTTSINRTGVTTNCLMYMLIRLATQNVTSDKIDDTRKSLTIMDSINRQLSKFDNK